MATTQCCSAKKSTAEAFDKLGSKAKKANTVKFEFMVLRADTFLDLKTLVVFFQSHINDFHKNAHLMCPFCQKTFPQKFSLRRHIQNVHENAGTGEDCKNPFKCQTCGKSYKSQSGLTIHR